MYGDRWERNYVPGVPLVKKTVVGAILAHGTTCVRRLVVVARKEQDQTQPRMQ